KFFELLQELELKNVALTAGEKLKVRGEILHDAERFQIDLGCDPEDLALHFNPRFHDDADGAVLIYNSKIGGSWGDEKREIDNPLQRGSDVKVRPLFKVIVVVFTCIYSGAVGQVGLNLQMVSSLV
uniref:Galectin n=1 Tax=Oryzias sinensis TaxID=183150 RepID=A0A8C7X248_9TELE